MKIINDRPMVVMTWEELTEMLQEIPVEKIIELSWFKWEIGNKRELGVTYQLYLKMYHKELFDKIFIELEEQVG